MRLDRLVSQGFDLSRSQAKAAIRQGRVSIPGMAILKEDSDVPPDARLTLDGQPPVGPINRLVMLHKPAGLLTAARDSKMQPVMELLPPQFARIGCMPIGRLDRDSEGLLLFSTDGELAHRLLSPRREVEKEYEVWVDGSLSDSAVEAFSSGIRLSDFQAMPARLEIIQAEPRHSHARVTLSEGKNRQVRRMFGALGHEVTRLVRTRFGPVVLDPGLAPGAWRDLNDHEALMLRKAVQLD